MFVFRDGQLLRAVHFDNRKTAVHILYTHSNARIKLNSCDY